MDRVEIDMRDTTTEEYGAASQFIHSSANCLVFIVILYVIYTHWSYFVSCVFTFYAVVVIKAQVYLDIYTMHVLTHADKTINDTGPVLELWSFHSMSWFEAYS